MRTPHPAPSSLLRYSPLAAALALAVVPAQAMAATYIVNDPLNTTTPGTCFPAPTAGTCTLHQAMQAAQSACDPAALIQFNLVSPFTISPSSPLPSIGNCPSGPVSVTLDGYSQLGASQNTLATGFDAQTPITLDGTSFLFFGGCALETKDFTYGEGSLVVRGLTVQNFTYGGAKGICGNVTVMGSRVLNNSYGIAAYAGAAIGGAALAQRNVITGNGSYGVFITSGTGITIVNNYIGTSDGFAAAPNGFGLYVVNASGTQIGGNVISGNSSGAMSLWQAPGTTISNNMIGANATGSAALPNGGDGISAGCTQSMNISSNVVSGNAYGGMYLGSVTASTVQGNKVGVATDGTTPMANGGNGISVSFSDCIFGSDSNTFQSNTVANNTGIGVALSSGNLNDITLNTITANGSHGVQVLTGATGNSILGNSIYGNAAKNIDLDFYGGPLPNDVLDVDTGANQRQNHPDISLVTQSGGNTLVAWLLNSEPGKAYAVEFFSNLAAGVPAGKTLIKTVSGTTDLLGNLPGPTTITGAWDNVSATATDQSTGDTSEFSATVALTPTPEVIVAPPSLAFAGTPVGAASLPQSVTLSSVGTAPYVISAFDSAATCYGGPICSSGSFICSNACATSTPYAPGSSCAITVTFAPIVVGPQSETLYICDNATGSPRPVLLSGTGLAPTPITITPTGYDFGTVLVGSSASKVFTISNPSATTATLTPPIATPPFQVLSTTCTSSLAPSATCDATVKFAPVSNGPASGTFSVGYSGGTATAPLAGTGLLAPVLALTPTSIDFGTLTLGGSTATFPLGLRNAGNAALTIDSITVSSPFTLTHNCPTNLLPNDACVATVAFEPAQLGTFNGAVAVLTNAPGGSRSVPVRANVQPRPEPIIRVTPTSIGFGERLGGTQSPSQRVTVTNEGGADAAGLALSISTPHFVVLNSSCGPVLAPQSTCFADVAFQPIGFGPKRATLSVSSTAPTAMVGLSGAGCRPPLANPGRSGRPNCAP